MTERNVITGTTTTGLITVFWEFYAPLIPFLVLALAFVLIDLKFGIAAAKRRIVEAKQQGKEYEPVRLSRAIRRTINKLTDYFCWVTLAGLFGHAYGTILGVPALAAFMLIIVYGIELTSCYDNFFFARGINKKVRINFNRLFKDKVDIIDVNNTDINQKNDKENE